MQCAGFPVQIALTVDDVRCFQLLELNMHGLRKQWSTVKTVIRANTASYIILNSLNNALKFKLFRINGEAEKVSTEKIKEERRATVVQ